MHIRVQRVRGVERERGGRTKQVSGRGGRHGGQSDREGERQTGNKVVAGAEVGFGVGVEVGVGGSPKCMLAAR